MKTPPKMLARIRGEGDEVVNLDIFDEIGGGWFGEGVTSKDVHLALRAASKNAKTINVTVNSVGGVVTEGMAIYAELSAASASVEVTVVGLAASMASVIAMAGDKVTMTAGSFMMIHNPWGIAMGDEHEMAASAELLGKVRGEMVAIYSAKTGRPEKELEDWMRAETWFTADEAKKYGFADAVVKPKQAERAARAQAFAAFAAADPDKVPKLPDAVRDAAARALTETTQPEARAATAPVAPPDASAETGGAQQQKETIMNLEQLKAQHPDVYAAAVKETLEKERDRVNAHLELGETCGAMALAIESVKSGAEMSQTLNAKYLGAGIKANAVAARQSESNIAGEAVNGAKPVATTKTLLDHAADAVCGPEA